MFRMSYSLFVVLFLALFSCYGMSPAKADQATPETTCLVHYDIYEATRLIDLNITCSGGVTLNASYTDVTIDDNMDLIFQALCDVDEDGNILFDSCLDADITNEVIPAPDATDQSSGLSEIEHRVAFIDRMLKFLNVNIFGEALAAQQAPAHEDCLPASTPKGETITTPGGQEIELIGCTDDEEFRETLIDLLQNDQDVRDKFWQLGYFCDERGCVPRIRCETGDEGFCKDYSSRAIWCPEDGQNCTQIQLCINNIRGFDPIGGYDSFLRQILQDELIFARQMCQNGQKEDENCADKVCKKLEAASRGTLCQDFARIIQDAQKAVDENPFSLLAKQHLDAAYKAYYSCICLNADTMFGGYFCDVEDGDFDEFLEPDPETPGEACLAMVKHCSRGLYFNPPEAINVCNRILDLNDLQNMEPEDYLDLVAQCRAQCELLEPPYPELHPCWQWFPPDQPNDPNDPNDPWPI